MMGELYMPLEGLVDVAAERERLDKEILKVEKELAKSEGKLGNANFVDRAKPEVVELERARLVEWKEKLQQLQDMRKSLE
jgi:valyl-tRNA synthetase